MYDLDFNANNSKKYKVEAIWDKTVYTSKEESYLSNFYYIIVWKSYSKEKKYLQTFVSNLVPKKADLLFLKIVSRETNSNFFAYPFFVVNDKANNQVY